MNSMTTTHTQWGEGGRPRVAAPQVMTDLVQSKHYVVVPEVVLDYLTEHAELSDLAFRLYIKLYRLAYRYQDQHDWAAGVSCESLAQSLGRSIRTIERAISELVAAGLLARRRRRDGPAISYVTLPYSVGQDMLKNTQDRGRARSVAEDERCGGSGDNRKAADVGDGSEPARADGSLIDGINTVGIKERDKRRGFNLPPNWRPGARLQRAPAAALSHCTRETPDEWLRAQIHRRLSKIHWLRGKQLTDIADQIFFQARCYPRYAQQPVAYTVNALCKLVRTNQWRTPVGYMERRDAGAW